MNLLYVKASPRGEDVSRTLKLAEAFWDAYRAERPGDTIITHDVSAMGLLPIDGESLNAREALIDARVWDDPLFAPARDFAAADAIIVASPYWDLMFPAMLKTYIEHVFIRELTFCYRDDRPIGLCCARRAVFLTTAGSPIAGADFGTDYLRATLSMLGVGSLDAVTAQGLDLANADTDGILKDACARAADAAKTLAEAMTE